MYKAAADSQARRTKTGSYSTTPDQRGRFDAMVAKAKPELMEICSLEEQEKILSERTAFTQERLAKLNKLMSQGTRLVGTKAAAERVGVLEQHNEYKAKLLAIRSLRKRATNITYCEVFREVAGFVLPQELIARICREANDIIMTARREVQL